MTKSIGKILRNARERKKLTMEQVQKGIKIHSRFVSAMERDDYSVFSGKVHSKGFLKLYASFLDLNIDEIMALWRREYERDFEIQKEERFFQKKEVETPKLIITPVLVLIVFGSILVTLFFGYLFYQYKNYTGAPKLDVYYPENNLVLEKDVLDITGKTDLDSEVYINNQKVVLGPDGSFAESVKLKEGLNTISIKSLNKLQQQTEVIRTIIFRPVKEKIEESVYPVISDLGNNQKSAESEYKYKVSFDNRWTVFKTTNEKEDFNLSYCSVVSNGECTGEKVSLTFYKPLDYGIDNQGFTQNLDDISMKDNPPEDYVDTNGNILQEQRIEKKISDYDSITISRDYYNEKFIYLALEKRVLKLKLTIYTYSSEFTAEHENDAEKILNTIELLK